MEDCHLIKFRQTLLLQGKVCKNISKKELIADSFQIFNSQRTEFFAEHNIRFVACTDAYHCKPFSTEQIMDSAIEESEVNRHEFLKDLLQAYAQE